MQLYAMSALGGKDWRKVRKGKECFGYIATNSSGWMRALGGSCEFVQG